MTQEDTWKHDGSKTVATLRILGAHREYAAKVLSEQHAGRMKCSGQNEYDKHKAGDCEPLDGLGAVRGHEKGRKGHGGVGHGMQRHWQVIDHIAKR